MIDRARTDWTVALAFLPFVIFAIMFEAIPVVILLVGSIGGIAHPTLKYLATIFGHPVYRQAVINMIFVAGVSSFVVPANLPLEIVVTGAERWFRSSTASLWAADRP